MTRRRSEAAPGHHVDFVLLFATAALMVTGTVLVYFATSQKLAARGFDPAYYLKRDVIYMVAGVIALVVTAVFDYRSWKGFIPVIYGGIVFMLLAVLSPLGSSGFGAKSWFATPFFDIEPAEFAKPAMIVVLAFVISERRGEVAWRDIWRALGLLAPPALLIFIQPDLGTSLVFVAIVFVMLLVGGARPRSLGILLLGGIVGVTLVFQVGVLKDYQVKRLTAFVDQNDQALGEADGPGYNVQQAKAAISAGGIFGRGPGNSTQTNLGFVPVQESDFIFTVMGEAFGFAGCSLLLLLFGLLIWRAWRIATLARDHFGALLAGGIVGMLVFQMFVNIGMTLGMMPVTGIPLPLVSLGGSALISTCVCIGLLLNVHMRRFQ
jgi:rod shape determining protein RodA